MKIQKQKLLIKIYQLMLLKLGPQNWWPAKTRFEVMVGAMLTQNTNWQNVTKAINNLKQHKMLSPAALKNIKTEKLASLITSAGYFNVKAKRLKNYIDFFFKEYNGSIPKMMKEDTKVLREKLLNVNGVGPETADSILLYALDKPVFVIDAYTKRILLHHKLIRKDWDYHRIQKFFTDNLKPDVQFYNEYHALFVKVGNKFCKKNCSCKECPLNVILNKSNRGR